MELIEAFVTGIILYGGFLASYIAVVFWDIERRY